jgi:hypothetical protein
MNPIGPDGDQRYMQANLTTMQGIAASAAQPQPAALPAPEPEPAAPPEPPAPRARKPSTRKRK